MADLRKVAKAVTSVIKGAQDVLPAEERAANLAKMLEGSAVKQRLYHGTKNDISAFDLARRGSSDVSSVGGGVYLTPDPNVASFYSKIVPGESGSNVMPVYAQVKNPYEYDVVMPFKSQKDSNEFSRRLQEAGYDSIIKRDKSGEIAELVVFDPNKIKSAIGNRGTYDVTKKDITKAKGGPVKMAGGGRAGLVEKIGKALTSTLREASESPKAAQEAMDLIEAERALPLRLARAPAKSQAEIAAHAERVGRQMLGEHVRGKKTDNLAKRSLKESERVKRLEYKLTPTKELPESVPYEPKIGEMNIALPGDYTVSDVVLESIGDIPIGSKQLGGSRYGLGKTEMDEPLFWASNPGPAQLFQNKVTDLSKLFEPERVVGQHLAMGRDATNFAQHFADANLRSIDYSKLSRKDMEQFDKIIAAGDGKKVGPFPDWPGIADPQAAYEAMRTNPELRKWFNDRMKTPTVTKPLSLPNGLDVEWAITHPELRNMEINLTGHSIGEMVPGASLTDTAAHETYSKGIRGKYLGHQKDLTPFVISFPDAAQHIASTKRPEDFTGTIQKIFPHQRVDQQYIDELGEYSRQLERVLRGRKNGGEVSNNSFSARFKELLDKHLAEGGPADTRPDVTDSGNIIQDAAFAKGGSLQFRSLRNRKPKRFDKGGVAFTDPLGAPDAPVDPLDRRAMANVLGNARKALEREFALIKDPKTRADILKRIGLTAAGGGPDLANLLASGVDLVQEQFPALREPVSVMGPEVAGYRPKFPLSRKEIPGGSEHLLRLAKESKLIGDTEAPILEGIAGFAGPVVATPALKAVKAAPRAAKGLVNAMVEPVNPRLAQRGAITWHGSPHRFPPTEKNPLGEFDPTKIGSGEGAQAFGYGHYVAESKGTGESYRAALANKIADRLTESGNKVDSNTMYGRALEHAAQLKNAGWSAADAKKSALQQIDDSIKFNESYAPSMASLYKEARKRLEATDLANVELKQGHLYKIDIPDEQIAKMLDWDKPLSEQPKTLQEIAKAKDPNLASKEPHFVTPTGDVIHWSDLLNSAEELKNPKLRAIAPKVHGGGQWVEYGDYMMKKTTGEDFYRNLSAPSEWQETSSVLRELGIPGIRYLDQASRAAGKGTSNFVVFPGNEGMMKIIERQKRGGLAQVKR